MLGGIITAFNLLGTALNCKQIKFGFVVWFFCNIGWLVVDLMQESYPRAVLDVVQAGTSVWGWIEWSKKEKK